jgi:hypothetical protein
MRRKLGWEIQPTYQIKIHNRDEQLILDLQKIFLRIR